MYCIGWVDSIRYQDPNNSFDANIALHCLAKQERGSAERWVSRSRRKKKEGGNSRQGRGRPRLRIWMNRRTFCEQLRRRSAACGSGTILQLSCYSSAHNPHPPSLYHHHHKQLLVIMHWLGRLSSCPSSADWRRKRNVVLKISSRSRVGRRKMVVIDNRHTIKIQQVFVLIKDGLLEERGGGWSVQIV